MRLSSLSLAAVLICSAAAFAQHSSGGGGSSGGSSGGSGGGSHGSSGGSAAGSSTGSHSSGGSAAHGSSTSQGARGHNSSSASSHSSAHLSRSSPARTNSAPGAGVRAKFEPSGRRSFFSFLRHPFRKPEPKTDRKPKIAADLRRPICFKGPCLICPAGQANGVCAGLVVDHRRNLCSTREIWSGGACLLQTSFLDDCSGMRLALEQQAQRMQAAEGARQSACSAGSREECSDRAGRAQSETSLYETLQARYRMCQRRSRTAYPFSGPGGSSYSPGLRFDRLARDVNYR
jgi:hypothetical protein